MTKSSFYSSFLILLLVLVLFSGLLQVFFSVFSYADEIVLLILIIWTVNFCKIPKEIIKIFFLICMFSAYSLFQSIYSPYFRGVTLTILDSILLFKSIFYFLIFACVPQKISSIVLARLGMVATFSIMLFFITYVLNLIFNYIVPFDYRLGIPSYSWFFSNPGEFLNIVFIMHVLTIMSGSTRNFGVITYIAFFLQLTALRFKGFVLGVFFLFLLALLREDKKISFDYSEVLKRRLIYVSPILIPVLFLVGYGQFEHYFLGELTPRLFLVISSFSVAQDYLPFGSGGGTFGSAIANAFYSPLYIDLGFDGSYGLGDVDDDANFLSDQFWPMIIAQYGFLGLFSLLYILFSIYSVVRKKIYTNRRLIISFYALFFSFLLSTFGSAIMIGFLGCFMFGLFGLMYAAQK